MKRSVDVACPKLAHARPPRLPFVSVLDFFKQYELSTVSPLYVRRVLVSSSPTGSADRAPGARRWARHCFQGFKSGLTQHRSASNVSE